VLLHEGENPQVGQFDGLVDSLPGRARNRQCLVEAHLGGAIVTLLKRDEPEIF